MMTRRLLFLPLGALLYAGTCGMETACSSSSSASGDNADADAHAHADAGACGDPNAICPAGSTHYDESSCSDQCPSNAAYCTRNLGFNTEAPAGCTLVSYNCIPEGSGGASCDVFFCCPGISAGDASSD